MKVKYYSLSNNGLFEFEGECQPNPRVPGEYLLPAHSTVIPPPDEKQGFDRFFDRKMEVWGYQAIPDLPDPPKEPEPPWDNLRRSAYFSESDPLLYEYLFDSERKDKTAEVSKEAWLEKVKEIKERYPKPSNSNDLIKGVR